jgi:hypothetical protein
MTKIRGGKKAQLCKLSIKITYKGRIHGSENKKKITHLYNCFISVMYMVYVHITYNTRIVLVPHTALWEREKGDKRMKVRNKRGME